MASRYLKKTSSFIEADVCSTIVNVLLPSISIFRIKILIYNFQNLNFAHKMHYNTSYDLQNEHQLFF
jgi:hypothetical protein